MTMIHMNHTQTMINNLNQKMKSKSIRKVNKLTKKEILLWTRLRKLKNGLKQEGEIILHF